MTHLDPAAPRPRVLYGPARSFSDLTDGDIVRISSDSPPQILSLTPAGEEPPPGASRPFRVLAVAVDGTSVEMVPVMDWPTGSQVR